MNYNPETLIYFLRTGIDDQNKVVCKNQSDLFTTLTSSQFLRGRSEADSFQRADGGYVIRINHEAIDYYNLLMCDTIMYLNQGTPRAFYIVGNILSVEWRNPDCSFVTFKIDHFMTYQTMIDWSKTYAYIEREHVKSDWNGNGHPNFTNMGPAEDFDVIADTPIYHYEMTFKPDYVLIHSPYNEDGEAVFEGEVSGNLYSSLNTQIVAAPQANSYFEKIAESKEASINNIVAVYGVPTDFMNLMQSGGAYDGTHQLPPVDTANMTQYPIEYRNAKCWSAPFCVVKLQSSEGSEMDFNPQWFGNATTQYNFKYKYGGAGKQFGGAMATFDNSAGAFDWKNWSDFCVMISQLPMCPWTADGFREWKSTNTPAMIGKCVQTGVSIGTALAKAVTGFTAGSSGNVSIQNGDALLGAFKDAGSAAAAIGNLVTSIRSARQTGAVVDGTGSYGGLFDIAQDAWGFKVMYLVAQNYLMRSIDQFFDRFGYKVNTLKQLNLENRPVWTFLKTIECHVCVGEGVPYVSEKAINAMFNAGVTMWKGDKFRGGRAIGDYSNPEENKGVG